MNHSDQVRNYVLLNYITPARKRGDATVSIRAGDIHRELNFRNRLPLVCAALGAHVFEEMANVERMSITGPVNGANAIFTFKIK